jgi:transcriptional regulator with XRE-family HTH domain
MKLQSYLMENDLTLKEFAEMLGYNPCYLSRIACGSIHPGKKLGRQIQEMTHGQVHLKMKPKKVEVYQE